MLALLPSRIPAWLAPVCDDRSVSHSLSAWVPSASQRAMFGVLPSRIARRSTGSARPSISRNRRPGLSVTVGRSVRRPTRRATESVYASSSSMPVITPIGVLIADAITATSSASARPSTRSRSGTISAAARRMAASSASASRNPIATVNGSRSAATSGGSTALRMPTIPATATAPPNPLSSAPGAIAGGEQQRDRGAQPRDQQAQGVQARPLGTPVRHGQLSLSARARPGRPRVNQSDRNAKAPTAPIARLSPCSWASP